MNLIFISADSTTVYYEIEDGLGEPLPDVFPPLPEEKRDKIDSTLRKHKNIIEQAALYGVPVTLPNKGQSS